MTANFEDGMIARKDTTAEDWVDSLDFDRIDHFTIQECLEFIKLSSQEVPEDPELVILINKVRLECAERLYSLLGMKILPPLYGPGVSISGPTTYKNCDMCGLSTHDTDECLPGTTLPIAQTVFPKDCYLKSSADEEDSQDKWTDSRRELRYPGSEKDWILRNGHYGGDRRRFKDPREDLYHHRHGPQVTTLGEPCRDRSLDTVDNNRPYHRKYWKYSSDEA